MQSNSEYSKIASEISTLFPNEEMLARNADLDAGYVVVDPDAT